MKEAIKMAQFILDEHYKYYTRETIDDTEMIKELKFIFKGIRNYLNKRSEPKKNIM
ncbi:MAG: hypothetical protein HY787_10415 [Deltaproteobacteria bacterium]|nr:hypothetical protein [Deltaproteobacteria bacterium]